MPLQRVLWTAGLLVPWPRRVLRRLLALLPGRGDPVALEADRLGPWVTRFTVDGVAYGGSIDLSGDPRVADFFAAFPGVRTVLELGSLEGAHSFQLAGRVEHVLAVEGREGNVAKARFVQGLLGVDNVEFRLADLETFPLHDLGRFDAVFCSGLLYHLPEPWRLLDQLAEVAPRVLVATHYAAAAEAEHEGVPGRWFRELGRRDPLSGLSRRSFWMTLPALVERLERNGFATEVRRDDPEHVNGPLVTVTAALR
jgi:SAM-dependent methyltransferase